MDEKVHPGKEGAAEIRFLQVAPPLWPGVSPGSAEATLMFRLQLLEPTMKGATTQLWFWALRLGQQW